MADRLVLELTDRPPSDLDALKDVNARIGIGLDIRVNHVETPEAIARASSARKGARTGSPAPCASGLWLLDVETLDCRPQNRGRRRGARFVFEPPLTK
jgi:hypothetical protein